MAMAEEFRAMTQDIAASFDVRKGEVESLSRQVSGMIGDFRKTRLHDTKTNNKERRRDVSDFSTVSTRNGKIWPRPGPTSCPRCGQRGE